MRQGLIKKKIRLADTDKIKPLLSGLGLQTICVEAMCPNISECFARSYATFLILGDICTRGCRFCNVKKGVPKKTGINWLPPLKEAVRKLHLRHVVITSPTRDDLADGGAEFFYRAVYELKKLSGVNSVEALVPDFQGSFQSIEKVLKAEPDIFGHNLETVRRLYSARRGASYSRSISVLGTAKKVNSKIKTKSALILGLGEEKKEVLSAIEDLARAGCNYLAIGQYLAPAKESYPIKKIIAEEEFMYYKERAYALGLEHVEAGTYVRSSYQAESYMRRSTFDVQRSTFKV